MVAEKDEKLERAIQLSVRTLMSGRGTVAEVVQRLSSSGFERNEIEHITREAGRRIEAFRDFSNSEFNNTAIKIGALLLLGAIVAVAMVGYPEYGRGRGILMSAILFGGGSLFYGAYGRIFKR